MPRKRKALAHQENNFKTAASCVLSGVVKEKPQQRNAANARERARMRVLSRAFCRLKTTLPWVPADTKLSKLDTLRLASSYIAHLKGILRDDPSSPQEPLHPAINLTWPFGFNRCGSGGVGVGGGGTGSSGRGGGSAASVSDEGEESDSNSEYWREVALAPASDSNSKDCIHLDPSTRYDDEDVGSTPLHAAPPMYRHSHFSVHLHSHSHQQINTSDVSNGLEFQ